MSGLRVVTDGKPPVDDQTIIAEALVAMRRVAHCESLPRHARRAIEAGEELLEMYVEPRRRS